MPAPTHPVQPTAGSAPATRPPAHEASQPASGHATLVLASASTARAATLAAAGIDPVIIVSDVDEDRVLTDLLDAHPTATPAEQVLALARAKARRVAHGGAGGGAGGRSRGHVIVLGCDSMLELDGEVLGKPSDARDAAARIAQQSGRSATLHTGHWLISQHADDDGDGGRGPAKGETWREVGATSSTVVRFGDLTRAEIEAYVATGEPLRVAGAFTIDGLGGPFIEGLDGDHHGVVGLSLPTLRRCLAEVGVTVMDLWRAGTIRRD
ncbi:MAG: Maf family nucleotide pyrophosphatase [Bifidobacteriaceae bacterium]|jgi:septum formation protein|nr:Maf family nucleotide pyrophosphatase [Bifidobacteriaceae bacterium]